MNPHGDDEFVEIHLVKCFESIPDVLEFIFVLYKFWEAD